MEVFLGWVTGNGFPGLPVFIKLNEGEPSTPSTLKVVLQYAGAGKGGGPMNIQERWQPDGHGYMFDFWEEEDKDGFKVDAGLFLTTDMRCFRGTPSILPVVGAHWRVQLYPCFRRWRYQEGPHFHDQVDLLVLEERLEDRLTEAASAYLRREYPFGNYAL